MGDADVSGTVKVVVGASGSDMELDFVVVTVTVGATTREVSVTHQGSVVVSVVVSGLSDVLV